MRESVRQILFGRSDQSSTFKNYVDVKVIGEKILQSLWTKTVKKDGQLHFISDDKEQKTGFLCDVYGCAGVFSLINRMGVQLPDEYKHDLEGCVTGVFDYIENNGYNLYPYVSERKNSELFSSVYPYTGAMTWCLSLLSSVRKATKAGLLELDQKYDDIIVRQMRKIINKFNESVIGTADDPLGWNYTLDCKKPSLFFTYSVLEAYSDFEDNILLEDADGNPADTELIALINENKSNSHIEADWGKTCKKVAENVWQKYKTVLKTDLVSDDFLENIRTVTKDDLLKASSSNALFNTVYIIFILIYGYANVRDDEQEQEDVVATMNAALQNVQRIYEQLSKENKEYVVDTYYMNYQSMHEAKGDKFMKLLNAERLIDASIVPILVKANNIIAFYISRYPQKQMSTLFLELFDRMNAQDWIWDNMNYDIENTERYIEAIADFYQYYDTYEREYAERLKTKKELEKEAEIKVEKRVEKALRERIKKDVAKEHEDEIAALRQSYEIENLLRRTMKDTIRDQLVSSIAHIIDFNYGKDVQLEEHEKALHELFGDMIYSYIDKYVRVNAESDEDVRQLRTKLKADAEKFADGWVRKLRTEPETLINIIEGDK